MSSICSTDDVERSAAARRRIYGLVLMSGAGLFVTVANTMVQLIHHHGSEAVSSLTILCTRSMFVFIFSIPFMIYGRVNPCRSRENALVLSALGSTGVCSILFVYLALEKIPVGDATVIQFTAPVFTSALSRAVLNQPCSIFDALCGLISFGGVLVMTRPTVIFGRQDTDSREICEHMTEEGKVFDSPTHEEYTFGVAYALVAALLLSFFYILNKLAGRRGDLILNIFYTGIVGSLLPPILLVGMQNHIVLPSSLEIWGLLVLNGLLSFIHLLLIAEALQLEHAGPAALVRNFDVVYAFLLQFIFLGVAPQKLTIVGATVVFIATTAMGVHRFYSAKKLKEEEID